MYLTLLDIMQPGSDTPITGMCIV